MPPALRSWFTPLVAADDRFVAPNFDFGQFFFTRDTATRLVDALDGYRAPCCLCTPRLAFEWHQRGRAVTLLDIDRRFERLPGYRHFDLLTPEPIGDTFDAVICDPIFVPAAAVRRAIDVLTDRGDAALFLVFPIDRDAELRQAFADRSLTRLPFPVHCCNIKPEYRGLVALYGTEPLAVRS
jgi:hypothetical protein